MMEYKGCMGKVEFDDEAGIFHGEVMNTRDVITFQGDRVADLKSAFHESVPRSTGNGIPAQPTRGPDPVSR